MFSASRHVFHLVSIDLVLAVRVAHKAMANNKALGRAPTRVRASEGLVKAICRIEFSRNEWISSNLNGFQACRCLKYLAEDPSPSPRPA